MENIFSRLDDFVWSLHNDPDDYDVEEWEADYVLIEISRGGISLWECGSVTTLPQIITSLIAQWEKEAKERMKMTLFEIARLVSDLIPNDAAGVGDKLRVISRELIAIAESIEK